jgi:hypothetical protein
MAAPGASSPLRHRKGARANCPPLSPLPVVVPQILGKNSVWQKPWQNPVRCQLVMVGSATPFWQGRGRDCHGRHAASPSGIRMVMSTRGISFGERNPMPVGGPLLAHGRRSIERRLFGVSGREGRQLMFAQEPPIHFRSTTAVCRPDLASCQARYLPPSPLPRTRTPDRWGSDMLISWCGKVPDTNVHSRAASGGRSASKSPSALR